MLQFWQTIQIKTNTKTLRLGEDGTEREWTGDRYVLSARDLVLDLFGTLVSKQGLQKQDDMSF